MGELEMLTDDDRALNEHLKAILCAPKNDDRQKFEEEWSKIYGGKGDFLLRHHTLSDQYANLDTQYAWEGWQTARRTTPDRDAVIEECAKVCDDRIMGDQSEGDFEAKRCAEAIRALKIVPTISPRDTLIEEIAEMVDHMGEGRGLEEYVGAIRSFKTAPDRALDRLAENERELGLDYMTAPTSDKGGA